MPIKQLFTEIGVSDKITELYTLTDQLLEEQAEAAKADFSSWLDDNFSFTDPQGDYLSAIDSAFLDDLGSQFSIALRNRLPISLIEPTVIDPDDYSSKILQTESTPRIEYNSVTGYLATGGFSLKIFLQP